MSIKKLYNLKFLKNSKLQYWLFLGITVLFVGLYSALFFGEKKIAIAYGSVAWDGGGGDGKWETAANWDSNIVPTSDDDVTIDNATVTLTVGQTANFHTLNIGSGTNATSLVLAGNIGTGTDINIANNATFTQQNSVQQTISGGLWVKTGGLLKHTDNSTAQSYIVNFSAASSTINGSINVDGLGYDGGLENANGNGPGPGQYANYNGAGGAHGGNGGQGRAGDGWGASTGGTAYCSIDNVATMGSGGAGGWNSYDADGGAGGGLIILNITGTLSLGGGTITADGNDGAGSSAVYSAGGGAGGGVKITAGTISGTPTSFTITGGSTVTNGTYGGGGGGGGCAQITYTSSNSLSASGIAMNGGTTAYQKGGSGQVLIKQSSSYGDLYLINTAAGAASTQGASSLTLDSLSLTYADYLVTSTASLSFSGSANPFSNSGSFGTTTIQGNFTLNYSDIDGATLSLLSGSTFTNPTTLNISNDGSLVIGSGATVVNNFATINSSGTLAVYRDATDSGFESTTDLTIQAGVVTMYNYTILNPLVLDELVISAGTLTHNANTTAQTSIVNITATSAIIAGTISADSKGYSGGLEDTNGNGPGPGQYANYNGAGGAHGGNGGQGRAGGGWGASTGGTAYCSIDNAATMGSGGAGGWSAYDADGGSGGGLIILSVTGTLNLEGGTLTADGGNGKQAGVSVYSGGGGAGGGVKITAGTISGTPTSLTVVGGNGPTDGTYGGGGGGGGCVQIGYSSSNSISSGGAYFSYAGGSGYAAGDVGLFGATQLNSAPTATDITPVQSSSSAVSFTTTIADADLNATSLVLEHSLDNSTWVSSTLAAVTVGEGAVTTSTGSIAGIDTNLDGSVDLTINWNIAADAPNTEDAAVYFRIIPNDGIINGSTKTSSAFGIDTKAPTVPGNLSISSTSTQSAVINFGAATTDTNFKEYKIYYKEGASGVTVSDTAHTSSTDANLGLINYGGASNTTISGFSTSTLYYTNIWAFDTYGNYTPASSEISFYTLATTPGAPTVTVSTTLETSVHLVVDRATNPNDVNTTYSICKTTDGATCDAGGYVELESGTLVASPDWHTYTAWGGATGSDILGLTPNTCYRFLVKARNGNSVETAFSSPNSSLCTMASAFTDLVAANATNTTTIQLTLTFSGTTQTGMKIDRDSACNGSFDAVLYDSATVWDVSPTTTSYNLAANTCYQFRIRSYNSQEVLNSASYVLSNQLTTPPGQPTGLAANTITENTIKWTWDVLGEASSYLLYNNLTGALIDTITGAVEYLQSGLASNTSQQVALRANNGNGTGVISSAVTAVTYADVVQNILAATADKTVSSIKWSWDYDGQEAYYAEDKNNTADNSGWITDTSTLYWNQAGLSANTQYTAEIKAKNSAGVETAFTEKSAYTAQNAPTGVSFSSVSNESITVTADGSFPNQGVGSSIINFNNRAGDSQDVSAGVSWTSSGLIANTRYIYTVYAKNGDGEPTNTTGGTKYTLANTPGQATVALHTDSDKLTITPVANSNPVATNFLFYCTTTAQYIDKSAKTLSAVREDNYDTLTNWGASFDVSGLIPNTAYQFQAIAKNAESVVTASSTASASIYTRAAIPSTLTTTILSATQIKVDWLANSNPDGTKYYIEDANDATRNSGWISALTYTFSGLTPGQEYTFQVKARNEDSVETDWLVGGAALTDPSTPGQITTAIGADSSSLVLTLAAGDNPPASISTYIYSTTTAQYVDKTTFALSDTRESNYKTFTNWDTVTMSGLSANTAYQFSAIARNSAGTLSATSTDSVAKYTRANIPTNLAATVGGTSQITLSWDANSNPSGTEYYVEDAVDTSKNSGWTTNVSYEFSGLTANTSYSFRVKARNHDNVETSYTATVSATTQSAGGGGAAPVSAPVIPILTILDSATVTDLSSAVVAEEITANVAEDIQEQLLSVTPISASFATVVFTPNSGISMNFGGENHSVILSGMVGDAANFILYSSPQKISLKTGEEMTKDLDKDGRADIFMKLVKVDAVTKQVKLTLIDLNDLPLAINNNLSYTTSTAVNLTIKEFPGVTQMAVSEDQNFTGGSFEPYVKTRPFNLSAGEGKKTVYVRLRNVQGGTSDIKASITYTKDLASLKNISKATEITSEISEQISSSAINKVFQSLLYRFEINSDVKRLQAFLKDLGYFKFSRLTNFFGQITSDSLKKYQKDNNLQATGYLDISTTQVINQTTKAETIKPVVIIKHNLCSGAVGDEVRELQKILSELGYFDHSITGYYGSVTREAVKKLQIDYQLTPSHGCVGPATRSILNEKGSGN